MLQLDDVPTHTLHIVQLLGVTCELQLTYFNPIHGEVRPLPSGPKVFLSTGSQRLSEAALADDGRASLQTLNFATNVHIEVDFGLHTHLDLEAETFVPHADVQAIDPRALIEMPSVWDSRQQAELSDDLAGRFSTGVLAELLSDQQGTPDAPWVLQVDFAWRKLYLRFDHYDPIADQHSAVPYGWRVHATSTVVGAPKLGSGSVIREDGLVYLPLVHAEEATRVRLLAGLPALSVIDLAEPDLRKRIKQVSPETYDDLAPDLRDEAYPLPTVWHARNQLATRATTSATYEAFADATTTPSEPIVFHLDDFALVNATAQPRVRFDKPLRLTLFDHVLAIRNQDPAEPYLTKGDFPNNHFSGRQLYAAVGQGAPSRLRVVRRGDAFYDLTRHRTIRGPLVGLRAAVRNDHPHESKKHYLHRGLGNYDLHYLHDCTILHGRRLSHIIVHWSCRFVPDPKDPFTKPEVDEFKRALLAAQHRWQGEHPAFHVPGAVQNPHDSLTDENGDPRPAPHPKKPKNYIIRTAGPQDDPRDTKVYFHFRSSDDEPVKCEIVLLQSQRAFMELRQARFAIEDRDSPTRADLMFTDAADGKTYGYFTLAHEIGHALGLPDEYLERLQFNVSSTVRLPVIEQGTFRTLHLGDDRASIMNANAAPRLRHFWPYARWMEENADVRALVGARRFAIHYPRPEGSGSKNAPRELSYTPPLDERDFMQPVAKQENFRHNGRRMDLALYRVGPDESPWGNLTDLADGLDGLFLVIIKMNFRFVENTEGVGWGEGKDASQDKVRALSELETTIRAFSGDKTTKTSAPSLIIFETAGEPRLRIALNIQSRYSLRRNEEIHKSKPPPPPALIQAHHRFHFRKATGVFTHDVGDIAESQHSSKKAHLVDGHFSDGTPCTPPTTFVRFLLGLPTTNTTGDPPSLFRTTEDHQAFVSLEELSFLTRWVSDRLNQPVTMRRIRPS